MVTPGRDAGGRLAPGHSPDRGRGKLAGTGEAPFPDKFRSTVMAIANTPVTVNRQGERRCTLSLFEVLVHRLAAGQTSPRVSPVPFIRLVIACAGQDALPSPEPAPPLPVDRDLLAAPLQLDNALTSGSDADVDDAMTHVLSVISASARRGRG